MLYTLGLIVLIFVVAMVAGQDLTNIGSGRRARNRKLWAHYKKTEPFPLNHLYYMLYKV